MNGFPFLIAFTQRMSLKNLYDQNLPGYLKPTNNLSVFSLNKIIATYDEETKISETSVKKTLKRTKPKKSCP